jgi:hypothetical protein
MNRKRVGRNDPCPCGSGKKYKRCCMGNVIPIEGTMEHPEPPRASTPQMQSLFDALHEARRGREPRSMAEEQQFADQFMREYNDRGLDEFDGLSPTQMRNFLHDPFESPDLVVFAEQLDQEPTGPMSELFRCIVESIDDKGLRLTPKGNLPRAVSRETALSVLGEERYEEFTSVSKISSEEDYPDLFKTRIVATRAGLLRKQHGKLFRTKRCDKLIKDGSLAGVYPRMLRAASREFNWGYSDRYPELWIIQHSFLFTLRLLSRHGNEWRGASFYADAFLRAFPDAQEEISRPPYSDPKRWLDRCFILRALERYAGFCGLAEIDSDPVIDHLSERRVRATPLLVSAVEFRV